MSSSQPELTTGRTIGWVLLAWLAGLGTIPFASAGAVAISQALGITAEPLGTVAVAACAAIVAWVFGRARTDVRSRTLVGGTYLLAIELVSRLLTGLSTSGVVSVPLTQLALQTLVAFVGAGTFAVLAERRRRMQADPPGGR